MNKPRTYATAQAFRIALEDRVKASARKLGHLDANRRRQLLLADRLLTRLNLEFGNSLVAKGGIALELRLPFARATRDLDVTVKGSSDGLLQRLQTGLWEKPYARLARINQLRWRNLEEALAAVRAFINPALRTAAGTWNPDAWMWT